MFHSKRKWAVKDVESPEALAFKLTEQSWTLCQGFRLDGYLFLNDQTSEDGVVEFGIVRESDMAQIESITFGWCGQAKALGYIKEIQDGYYDRLGFVYATIPRKQILIQEGHHCQFCD